MYTLLIHQWKSLVRSTFWQKNLILNLLIGLFIAYLAFVIVFFSLSIEQILTILFPNEDIVFKATALLFYYFIIDLSQRFFLQPLPALTIKPYLPLPIKKTLLSHYPLIISSLNVFSLVGLLLIGPFFIKNILPTQPFSFSLFWLLTIVIVIITNNWINFTLKKYFALRPWLVILILGLSGLIFYLDYRGQVSISSYFAQLVYFIAQRGWPLVFPLVYSSIAYFLAFQLLHRHAFIEDTKQAHRPIIISFYRLENYGVLGQLVGLELNLIIRNRRPRSLLLIGLALVPYLFINAAKHDVYRLFILYLAATMPSSSYGQMIYSWESSFFDGVLVRNFTMQQHLQAKYILLCLLSLFGCFVVFPFMISNLNLVLSSTAFLIFNIGINLLFLLYFTTYNSAYIDLGKSQFMNYQGTSIIHFLLILPIIGLPLGIYLLHKLFGVIDYYYFSIAFIGLFGIILSPYFLRLIHLNLAKRKYKMAYGFRQK